MIIIRSIALLMYVLPRFYLIRAYIIKPPNVKKQFCQRCRRCVRAYKLSQRRIKRNYWSGRIARAIPPCSYYSEYKPLNYDCLCSVHKSTYDIRYGESSAQVAAFIFLVVKAPITVDTHKSVFLFICICKRTLNVPTNFYTFRFNIKYLENKHMQILYWKCNPDRYILYFTNKFLF